MFNLNLLPCFLQQIMELFDGNQFQSTLPISTKEDLCSNISSFNIIIDNNSEKENTFTVISAVDELDKDEAATVAAAAAAAVDTTATAVDDVVIDSKCVMICAGFANKCALFSLRQEESLK